MSSRLVVALLLLSSSAFAQSADAPPASTPAPEAPTPAPDGAPTPVASPPAPTPPPDASKRVVDPAPVAEPPHAEHTLTEAELHAKSADETKAAKAIELKPGGYVQADTRSFATDTGTHDLTLRRLRFKLDGKAFKYFKVYALVDTAQSKLVVQNAYVELSPLNEIGLRVGKDKAQFGVERLQSATDLAFIERSFATQIAPNRDIGIWLRGDIQKGLVHYSLAAVDGVADNAVIEGETDSELEYNAHLLVRPLLLDKTLGKSADFAIGGAATWGRTHGTLANPGISSIKSAGQATIFKFAGGASTDTLSSTAVADGYRHRLTAHGYYYSGPVGALAEYVADYEPVAIRGTHTLLFQRAWQLASSVALTPGDQPTYKGIAPKHPFDLDKRTWGALELAARYGEIRLDGAAFMEGLADPSVSIHRARAGTLGLNWYFNKLFKVQLNYEGTVYKGGAPDGGNRPTEHLISTRFQAAI